jgi:hypothetical protein
MKYVYRTLALVATTVGLASGQQGRPDLTAVTNELQTLCKQVQVTEQAEEGILQNHKPAVVAQALAWANFWWFVTSPSTRYRDRMVAARQGGGLVGLDRLPELWKAQADLDRPAVPRILSPCDFLMSDYLRPRDWVGRHNSFPGFKPKSLLFIGQEFPKPIEYPIAQADRDNAPWLWQMQRMLPVLMNAVQTYYAQPDRYPAMAAVAWNWQTSDWWQASVRVRALVIRGPRNAAWLENVIRLALERPDVGPHPVGELYVYRNDSYHFEELVHAAQIIILQRTNSPDVATQVAFWISRLATQKYDSLGPNCPLKPLQTATATLAIARWALDQKIDAWDRYISYAGVICKMASDPPYHPDQQAFRKTGEINDALAAFRVWFAEQRPKLEEAAAAEHVHLSALAAELHQTIE